MMKNILKINSILSVMLILFLAGCEMEPETQDPISTENYPVATFNTDFSGTSVSEGDTIDYTITLDRMSDRDLTFEVRQLDGTADDHDFVYEEVTIPAYSLSADMQIVVLADDLPEEQETLKLEVGVFYVGERYILNPTTVNPVLDLTVTNFNDPNVLTVAFGWQNPESDIDLFAISEVDGAWGAAASADNPEILTSIWPSDPEGNYFVTIDPYSVASNPVNYWVAIGYPDQTNEYLTGTFDVDKLDSYTVDYFDAWDMDTYRILTVVVQGGAIQSVTHAN